MRVERLSDHVLPVAVTKEDGTVLVNENFVKVMHKIRELIAKQGWGKVDWVSDGDIHDLVPKWSGGHRELGQFYMSILYSVAIHEMKGHFRIENGVILFNPDESWAQGERGGEAALCELALNNIFLAGGSEWCGGRGPA
ncbi:MAG: hypothetical protein ABIA77_00890 [Candidatus Omnitrophota bacterium]